jgi:hypothetical protein
MLTTEPIEIVNGQRSEVDVEISCQNNKRQQQDACLPIPAANLANEDSRQNDRDQNDEGRRCEETEHQI